MFVIRERLYALPVDMDSFYIYIKFTVFNHHCFISEFIKIVVKCKYSSVLVTRDLEGI